MALSAEERAQLEALRSIGEMWQRRSSYLLQSIEHCYERASTKGLEEMVAYSFNGAGIPANYGSAGGLPVGKHPVKIVGSQLKPTQDNTGGYMELTLEAIDGPAKGAKAIDRLNLNNTNQTAVRIANEQLAAYCAVIGVAGFNDTNELHEKPFVVEMAAQKSNPQYTEVVGLFNMNGQKPGEIAGGGNAGSNNQGGGSPNNQQQGGGNNAGGGWNQGGGNGNANQGGNAAQGGNNAGGGGWGNGGGNAGNAPDQGAQGGNGGGWQQGGPANQQGGGNAAQGGGWQQGGGNQGGGSPGWGNPNG